MIGVVKLRKVNDSYLLSIPKALMEKLLFQAGDRLVVSLVDNKTVTVTREVENGRVQKSH